MLYRWFFLTFFIVSGVWADAPAPRDPIYYSFISEDGHYNFDGGFTLLADPSVVWNVLTDYNHYERFISNLKAKVLQGKPGEDLLVEEDAGGGFLFIQEHLKARLDIHEVSGQSISFQDIDHKQFALYAGVWTLQVDAETGKTRVNYALQATRSKETPGFLTTDLFGGSLGDLLTEMKKEMERRQVKKDKETPTPERTLTPAPLSTETPGN